MVKLEIYTGEKVYILNNGQIGTKDVIVARYPAILSFPHVISTDELGECFLSCDPLSRLMSQNDIDPATSKEEALAILGSIFNAAPEPVPPSADERIAAAMEFQNVLALMNME